MWWIIGLVIAGIFGIAQKILESLQQEVAVERKRWEDSYQQVEREVQQQQRIIEQKLRTSIELLQYQEVASLHSASIKLADTTHSLLQGSRKTLDAMGRAIVETAKQRKALEQRKRESFFGRGELEKQILALHKLRDEILVPDKDKVKAQRDRLLYEVQRLNRQTAELRELKKQISERNQRVALIAHQERENKRLVKVQQQQLESWVMGTVNWYDEQKGFGFITPNAGGSDVYVNSKQLRGITSLSKGDQVKFVLRSGDRPWAANVTKLNSRSGW